MKHGIIGAIVVVSVMASIYIANKELYLNPWVNWLILFLYVPYMWLAIRDFMRAHPETKEIRTIIRPAFLTFILINLGFYLLLYGLFLSDQELLQITSSREIQYFENELKQGVGDPQKANELRDQIQYLKTHGMKMPLGHLLLQMCMGAIGGFSLSALMAFMFQSRSK
jgi:hypothetical protein